MKPSKPSEWFVIRNASYYAYSGDVVDDKDAKIYNRILNLLEAVEVEDTEPSFIEVQLRAHMNVEKLERLLCAARALRGQ